MDKELFKIIGGLIFVILVFSFMFYIRGKQPKIPKMKKLDNNTYSLQYGSIKMHSEKKWKITSIDTLCGITKIENRIRSYFLHRDTMFHLPLIIGKHKSERIIIMALPITFFNLKEYQKVVIETTPWKKPGIKEYQKAVIENTVFNKLGITDILYDQNLNNIEADSIYRARMFFKDFNNIGICWELRFCKNTIQSVFRYKEHGGNVPYKDNSTINNLIIEPTYLVSKRKYYELLNTNLLQHTKTATSVHLTGGKYTKRLELVHIALLRKYLTYPTY